MPVRLTDENRLLVEGPEDRRLIPELIEGSGIVWGNSRSSWIVDVKDYGGKETLLRPGTLKLEFKSSGAKRVGVVLDADADCMGTWRGLRELARRELAEVGMQVEPPDELPPGGWETHCSQTARRFGVWIMPDNTNAGMLETFLRYLVPESSVQLWAHAQSAADGARGLGAPFKHPIQVDKANIYTWLAWQDPPGRQLHDAVKQRILRADSPYAGPFIDWFCRLFEVAR